MGARDHSTKTRKGGQWHIVSDAITKEDRVATAMVAAQDMLDEMSEAQVASVWLFLDEKYYQDGLGGGQIGEVTYIPDGKGKSGNEQNGPIWQVRISDTQINEKQRKILDAWSANKLAFKNTDGFIDEDRLVKFLAPKFNIQWMK